MAGLGGWAGGAVLGAAAAWQMEENGYLGVALGGVVGTAIVSAAPSFGAPCTFGTRLWRGAVAASFGTIVGLVLGGGLNDPVVYTVPLGTSAGAAIGADC